MNCPSWVACSARASTPEITATPRDWPIASDESGKSRLRSACRPALSICTSIGSVCVWPRSFHSRRSVAPGPRPVTISSTSVRISTSAIEGSVSETPATGQGASTACMRPITSESSLGVTGATGSWGALSALSALSPFSPLSPLSSGAAVASVAAGSESSAACHSTGCFSAGSCSAGSCSAGLAWTGASVGAGRASARAGSARGGSGAAVGTGGSRAPPSRASAEAASDRPVAASATRQPVGRPRWMRMMDLVEYRK